VSVRTTCFVLKNKVRVRFTVVNLTNKDALYAFSRRSAAHFVTPRAYQFEAGVSF
jgi:hypothetical protein